MKIVILDGGTTNPGDVSWAPLEEIGTVAAYDATPAELVTARAQDAEAVIMNRIVMSRAVMDALPKLRYIGTLATGYNTIDIQAAREKGITVCNVPLYCVETVAQQAFALLLELCNHTGAVSAVTGAGGWNDAITMSHSSHALIELHGKTLGIFGFGHIGQAAAKLGLAFGMHVIVNSRTRRALPEGCAWVDFETLFRRADVVSLHCPLNEGTRGLVNAQVLAWMKPTALLINTARGAVLDEHALADALNSGRLAGAGLDVLTDEPPKADNPLLTARNCILTPHIAWASRDARLRLIRVVADNLRAFLDGCPVNVVS
ncbi:MAG: D-2-hydroxyacid dehydrogenase [Hominenteromicrobium sp.]